MRRDILPLLGLFALLSVFGGFAYFTQNPDSPWLVRAEQWPWIGDTVGKFREGYGPAPEEPTWKPPKTEVVLVQPDGSSGKGAEGGRDLGGIRLVEPGTVPGSSSSRSTPLESETLPVPRPILEHRWFLPGHLLYEQAGAASPKTRLTSMARLPILAWEEPWAEVLLAAEPMWLDTSRHPKITEVDRVAIHPGNKRWLDQRSNERIAAAQELLGTKGPVATIGRHDIYSDLQDPRLFRQLEVVNQLVPAGYSARYGRVAAGPYDWGMVLFSREQDYRAFARESKTPRPDKAGGHAEHGFIAVYLERQSLTEFLCIVAHEQSHLLNKRTFSDELPPWLEEGLATDLGYLWVEDVAAQLTDLQGRERLEKVVGWEASLVQLQQFMKGSDPPALDVLWAMDRDAFYQNADWTYPYSAAVVRFLLDADDGRYADGFRSFLARIAEGEKPDRNTLLQALGVDGTSLEPRILKWIAEDTLRARKRVEDHRAQFYRDRWALEQEKLRQEKGRQDS